MDVVLSIVFGVFFFGLLAYSAKNSADAMDIWKDFIIKYGPFDND